MLQFLSRIERIVAGGHFRFLPDAMTPAEGRQRRIGHLGSTARQFFMDPDQVAFVRGQQFQDLYPVDFGLLGPDQHRQGGGIRLQDFAHAQA